MPSIPEPFDQPGLRVRAELSRKVQINSLGRQEAGRRPSTVQEIVVEAAPEECVALARRLGVPAVTALRCRFRLSPVDAAGRVSADGLLTATMTRVCVASLEEFPDEVVEAFRIRFVPASASVDEEEALDPDADDDVPYGGTQIDLGEAAVEQVALAMQPYPRKPGAALPDGIGAVDTAPGGDPVDGPEADEAIERPNPFAVLKGRMPG